MIMKTTGFFCGTALFLALGSASMVASADELSTDELSTDVSRVRFSGFGTLGVAHSDVAKLSAQRDWSQPNVFDNGVSWKMDSLVGAQMNADLAPNLEGVAQLVLKERAVNSLDEALEWVYLSWRPTSDLTLRVGRMGVDFYMLSDYRDVSFAYPWQRPPVEFYAPVLAYRFDGLDINYKTQIGEGALQTKLFGGTSNKNLKMPGGLGARSIISSELDFSAVWGGSLSYETEHWRLNAGFARTRLGNTLAGLAPLIGGLNSVPGFIWPEAAGYAQALDSKGKTFGFYSLGAAYDDSTWQVSGEVALLASNWVGLTDNSSAYLSVGRRFGSFTPYVLLSAFRRLGDRLTVTPSVYANPANPANPLTILDYNTRVVSELYGGGRRTQSMGVRWDIKQNVALKFQWDHTRFETGSTPFFFWNTSGVSPYPVTEVNLLSASVNWVF